jgi:hypothetical protein
MLEVSLQNASTTIESLVVTEILTRKHWQSGIFKGFTLGSHLSRLYNDNYVSSYGSSDECFSFKWFSILLVPPVYVISNLNSTVCISVLARQYLSIPGTSVPSERIFSATGLLVNKLRNRLSSSVVDHVIFLNKNCTRTSRYTIDCDNDTVFFPPL